jgi:hypothetical protein
VEEQQVESQEQVKELISIQLAEPSSVNGSSPVFPKIIENSQKTISPQK